MNNSGTRLVIELAVTFWDDEDFSDLINSIQDKLVTVGIIFG